MREVGLGNGERHRERRVRSMRGESKGEGGGWDSTIILAGPFLYVHSLNYNHMIIPGVTLSFLGKSKSLVQVSPHLKQKYR